MSTVLADPHFLDWRLFGQNPEMCFDFRDHGLTPMADISCAFSAFVSYNLMRKTSLRILCETSVFSASLW